MCPAGFYCLEGKQPQPCENGTYSNSTGLKSAADCILCDAGKVCSGIKLTEPNDICAPGEEEEGGRGKGGVCAPGQKEKEGYICALDEEKEVMGTSVYRVRKKEGKRFMNRAIYQE